MPRTSAIIAVLIALSAPVPVRGQTPARSDTVLTLFDALERARSNHPDLRAAREAATAAAALTRQAGAYPNPRLAYTREQVDRRDGTGAEDIVLLEQPLPIGGQRSARREAARLRHAAAQARLDAAQAQVDFDVTRAYALAASADRRAVLAGEAASAFIAALHQSEQRLAAGDVSGYQHRRLALEAARYGTLRAAAALERRAARYALATLIASSPDAIAKLALELALDVSHTDTISHATGTQPGATSAIVLDSLLALALARRAELRAMALDADAAAAEAELARRLRIPVPSVVTGFKREQIPAGAGHASGFVGGVSLPLPLWDRGAAAVLAADAETRRRAALVESLRRQTVREVTEAFEAAGVALEQALILQPQVTRESQLALRAAQAAYGEGEISLLEWLDAVRAYHDTQASWATLRAEAMIRLAELQRTVGGAGGATTGGTAR